MFGRLLSIWPCCSVLLAQVSLVIRKFPGLGVQEALRERKFGAFLFVQRVPADKVPAVPASSDINRLRRDSNVGVSGSMTLIVSTSRGCMRQCTQSWLLKTRSSQITCIPHPCQDLWRKLLTCLKCNCRSSASVAKQP